MARRHVLWQWRVGGQASIQPILYASLARCLSRIHVSQLVRVSLSLVHLLTTPFVNRYPARAFPGDTLCYVTGMAFSVVGIQGHFSKTLLLFFLPQIFNFVLSCPQLFGLVPCPRHRVPRFVPMIHLAATWIHSLIDRFDPDTNLLHPSKAKLNEKPPSKLAILVLRIFSTFGLTELTIDPKNGRILEATNLTILNFFLVRFGPMTEKRLVQVLMGTQVSIIGPMTGCEIHA